MEEVEAVDLGPLVYRDDRHFRRYKRKIVKRAWTTLAMLAIGEVVMIPFWIYSDHHRSGLIGIMFFLLFFGPLVVYYGLHLQFLDRGVAVHRTGVDMVGEGIVGAFHVFVPWDEMESVTRKGSVFGILLHGGTYVQCRAELVDEYTEHTIRSMKEGFGESGEPPDLVVYPRGGGGE